MKTITYKGYQASVEFDHGTLFVRVLHVDDLLLAECDKASEAEDTLKDLVDAYLEDCKEIGKEPTKPFSGTFNVRIGADLHKRVAFAAASEGCNLNSWVSAAISEKLECLNLSDRFDHVIEDARRDVLLLKQLHIHRPTPHGHRRPATTIGRDESMLSRLVMADNVWDELDG